MTREHLVRIIVIAVVFLGSLAALVALLLNGITEGTGFGAVLAAVSMSGPALLEALRVGQMIPILKKSVRPPPPDGVEEDTAKIPLHRKRKITDGNGSEP